MPDAWELETSWDEFEQYVRAAGVSWPGFEEEELLDHAVAVCLALLHDAIIGARYSPYSKAAWITDLRNRIDALRERAKEQSDASDS